MDNYTELLEFLKKEKEEKNRIDFLRSKAYADIQEDYFGINQWTSYLFQESSKDKNETQEKKTKIPDHLVSFVMVPEKNLENYIDIGLDELKRWITNYSWKKVTSLNRPFPQNSMKCCSDGLLLYDTSGSSDQNRFTEFLLFYFQGFCEYGLGDSIFYTYENETYFTLIRIVGKLWQFLQFIEDMNKLIFNKNNSSYYLFVNFRGTRNAILADLAKGWSQPYAQSFYSFRPKCLEKNIQIKRKIDTGLSPEQIGEIVHWYATRIDNAWGQFEPRCYVNKDIDELQPFATN